MSTSHSDVLTANYDNNLRLIGAWDPNLANRLQLHESGVAKSIVRYGNDYNVVFDGKPLYPQPVDAIFKAQAKAFIDNPLRLMEYLGQEFTHKEGFLFDTCQVIQKDLNSTDVCVNENKGKQSIDEEVSLLIVVGIGLGFHIKELVTTYSIQHLILIESDMDLFQASLHALDWSIVVNGFSEVDTRLSIIIESDGAKLGESILRTIAFFDPLLAYGGLLFEHSSNTQYTKMKSYVANNLYQMMSGWGYFDDERESLVQSMTNIAHRRPCLKNSNSIIKNSNAIVIGNGPSLEENAGEFLKINHSNAILFSCGSALSSLEKMNVKPDFHVEIERPYDVFEVLTHSCSENYLKSICLIAPTRVHPDVFSLFGNALMFNKFMDSGGSLLTQYHSLKYTAPTVANAALVLALEMGVETIYFLGMDLSYPCETQHHSKYSLYFNPEHPLYLENKLSDIKKQGVNGMVLTTPMMVWTLSVLEYSMLEYSFRNYFNLSQGLPIKGSKQKLIKEYRIRSPYKKSSLLDKCFSLFEDQYPNLPPNLLTSINQSATKLKKEITRVFGVKCSSGSSLIRIFMEINRYMKTIIKQSDPLFFEMYFGSIMTIEWLLITSYSKIDSIHDRPKMSRGFSQYFIDFINNSLVDIPKTLDYIEKNVRRKIQWN